MSDAIRIEPDGEALQALVAAARRGASSLAGARVFVEAWGLRFEISPSGLARRATDSGLEGRALLEAVRGPYCAACRRSVGAFSYTEWNVVEAESCAVPDRCPACGSAFEPPSHDAGTLVGHALRAALERIDEV